MKKDMVYVYGIVCHSPEGDNVIYACSTSDKASEALQGEEDSNHSSNNWFSVEPIRVYS